MENNIFNGLSREDKRAIIEALIFASDEPLNFETLIKVLFFENASNPSKLNNPKDDKTIQNELLKDIELKNEIDNIIQEINLDLLNSNRPYQIVEFGGGWQFATRKEYGRFVNQFFKTKFNRRLSNAALEVLAIIAYKQPITKAEIEQIRGVNSNEVVNSLLEKSFIKIAGRKNVLGRPLMFEVTSDFLRSFGLKSLDDLPKIKEFEDLVLQEFAQKDNELYTFDISNAEIEEIKAEQDTIPIESLDDISNTDVINRALN
jgi:segregation and condensation protein B